MGFFELFFGTNDDRNHKAREQEMANKTVNTANSVKYMFALLAFLTYLKHTKLYKVIITTMRCWICDIIHIYIQ